VFQHRFGQLACLVGSSFRQLPWKSNKINLQLDSASMRVDSSFDGGRCFLKDGRELGFVIAKGRFDGKSFQATSRWLK
jgi:hypothetical protein